MAIDGRLEWREWAAQNGSGQRQAISIVAERVQFLGARDAAEGDGRSAPESDVPADASDFEHVPGRRLRQRRRSAVLTDCARDAPGRP